MKSEISINLVSNKDNKRYELRVINTSFPMFLTNQDGEGMSLSEADLFEALDKIFKEQF